MQYNKLVRASSKVYEEVFCLFFGLAFGKGFLLLIEVGKQ